MQAMPATSVIVCFAAWDTAGAEMRICMPCCCLGDSCANMYAATAAVHG